VHLSVASSADGRALAIRDHLMPIVRLRGTIEMQRGAVRVTTLAFGPWVFHHWTPFNEMPAAAASSPGYRRAVRAQRQQPAMPYGLDVWRIAKVLRVLWGDEAGYEVVTFVRGDWEDEALAL